MKTKVLFVCMGNICRSPTAEGAFRQLVEDNGCSEMFEIDSAGTHAYHVGNPPDRRSQQAAQFQDVDLSSQRARQVHESDFYHYDKILAMDLDNFHNLKSECPDESQSEIELLLDYLPDNKMKSVPDPYYEGRFDEVFEMIHQACEFLLQDLIKKA
ncbi:MAG: low molecular weight protein-tyrosine-phosphatase [Gammaproteobacteria bacterium]|jgi:protein-tyrosine phosphatase